MNSRHTSLLWGHLLVPPLLYMKGHWVAPIYFMTQFPSFTPVALKFQCVSQLLGGIIKAQITGPCSQSFIVNGVWDCDRAREVAFPTSSQVTLILLEAL